MLPFALTRNTVLMPFIVHLAAADIAVRNVSGGPGLQGCIRMSVGTPEQNAALIAAIETWNKLIK